MPPPPSAASPLRIALVGAGRVGTGVAILLRAAGHDIVGVGSRTASSATTAARRLDAPSFEVSRGPPPCDLVLIGAPDRALEGVAETLAAYGRPGVIACHFAGAYGVAPLRALEQSGGRTCALHPVQACPDVDTAVRRLPGSAWGVTCSAGLQAWAADLVREDLRGHPVAVAEGDRAAWHAAAVVTANGIAALLAIGESVLASIRVAAPGDVLTPLALGAVANAAEGGGGAASLTGPVVRGERDTVARHLRALAAAPGLLEDYVAVARRILAVARRSGRVEAAAEADMLELLEAGWR